MLLTHYQFGPLRVLIDDTSGTVLAVQDALTGCAASLLYSQRDIAQAVKQAELAWASTSDMLA
jgi:hypothetical protein